MAQIDGDMPAFSRSDGGYSVTHDGLTIREYFAGQIAAGIGTAAFYVGERETRASLDRWAKQIWAMADALTRNA